MPLSLYEISIPVFITNLKNLSKFLEKGRLHASSNESALIEAKVRECLCFFRLFQFVLRRTKCPNC
jgi:hypothetical protein